MKKIVALMMAALTALVMLCGCSEAEKASYNIAKQADYFESERKITVYNARTDTIVMEAEGYMEAKVICTSSEVEPQLDGTPARLLRDQQRIMGEYLHILELRAEIEEIFI